MSEKPYKDWPWNNTLEDVLVGAAGLLDQIKSEWGEEWSDWDQSVRDGITRILLDTPPPTGRRTEK